MGKVANKYLLFFAIFHQFTHAFPRFSTSLQTLSTLEFKHFTHNPFNIPITKYNNIICYQISMGNVETVHHKKRKPIFKCHNYSRSYSKSPNLRPQYHKLHNQYNDDTLINHNIRNNSRNCSAYQGGQYKYSQFQQKNSHIYDQLQTKLSKQKLEGNDHLSQSSCIWNHHGTSNMPFSLKKSSINQHQMNSWQEMNQKNQPKEFYFHQNHPDKTSLINKDYSITCSKRLAEDSIPTQRKGPNWCNQELSSLSESYYEDNRNKCQQIIKKVRNFNDFLNLIKKKVESDQQDEKSANKQKQNQSKELSLMFKLQNEKVEVEKYKKMMERELSKQHSISSIQIQGQDHDPKEKIIKIKYQKELKNEIKIDQNPSDSYSSENDKILQQTQKFNNKEVFKVNNGHHNQSGIEQTTNQKLRTKYQELCDKLSELGDIIHNQIGRKENITHKHSINPRIKTINGLIERIEQVNHQQLPSISSKNNEPMIMLNKYYESDDD